MLGFKFVENFNFPYISKNIGEFWRRWNISLGSWFREYVYIPLGGSRVKDYQVYFNLGVVFLLTGIWHGASWNFVIWGIFNGAAVMIERLFLGELLKKHWVGFSHVYALLVILFNWVFFRADSLRHALSYIKAMILNWDFVGFMNYIDFRFILIMIFGIFFSTPVAKNFFTYLESKKNYISVTALVLRRAFLLLTLIYSVMLLVSQTHNPFIYFRF